MMPEPIHAPDLPLLVRTFVQSYSPRRLVAPRFSGIVSWAQVIRLIPGGVLFVLLQCTARCLVHGQMLKAMFKHLPGLVSGDPGRKRAARYKVVKGLARRWEFGVYERDCDWFQDESFMRAWHGFPNPENLINERRYCLYGLARASSHVPGALAECGVRWGRGSHLLLTANQNDKHLFGFDSFDGLSAPEAVDLDVRDGAVRWQAHDLAIDEEVARQNLSVHEGRVTLLKGWIPERFEEVSNETFSFVHLDLDLHRPTLDSLEFFWPRMTSGGVILGDDYGSYSCPGVRKAFDEFAEEVGVKVGRLTTIQAFITKP